MSKRLTGLLTSHSSTPQPEIQGLLLILFWIFTGFSPLTSASMQLDKVVTYFDADKLPRQDILVTNTDSEKLFLETEIFKVEHPGANNEERIRIIDPDKIQLLATPDKSIIPAGGHKTVRLLYLDKPPTLETVYRVTFKPVVGNLYATESAVKIIVAYQVLVFIRPKNPFINVSGKAMGDEIMFTNMGNINVVLRNGRYCPAGVSLKASHKIKLQQCTELSESNRIYAGESWTMRIPNYAKPQKGFVEYGLFDGKKELTRQFGL